MNYSLLFVFTNQSLHLSGLYPLESLLPHPLEEYPRSIMHARKTTCAPPPPPPPPPVTLPSHPAFNNFLNETLFETDKFAEF